MLGECEIVAYFAVDGAAHACQQALRAQGFEMVRVSRQTSVAPDHPPDGPQANWGIAQLEQSAPGDDWTLSSSATRTALVITHRWQLSATVAADRYADVMAQVKQFGGRL
ncbi:MAG: hypothetical protein M0Z53_04975 [Thermaerobacter sp.]|nr:hypothetical protein [Thermaerobacter sp.]